MKKFFILLNMLCSNLYSWPQASLPGSGNAVRFDGVNDEIKFPQQKVAYDNFTMEAWVNPQGATDLYEEMYFGLMGSVGRHQYLIYPTYGLNGIFENIDVMAGAGIEVGINGISVYEHSGFYMPPLLVWHGDIFGWTHIAVVYTDRQPSLYVNGTLVRTGFRSQRLRVYASNEYIGGNYWGHFQGEADEIRIWNKSLTASEIKDRINRKIAATDVLYQHLVNYYNMDESSGDTVFDGGFVAASGLLLNGTERIKSGAIINDTIIYCQANGLSGAHGYIQNVSIQHGFSKSSGWNGYSDFTSSSVSAAPGDNYDFQLRQVT